MATVTTPRPVVTPAPLPHREVVDARPGIPVESDTRPVPTVLNAFHWNEFFGPWVRGIHNFRPVIEAAIAMARSRAS